MTLPLLLLAAFSIFLIGNIARVVRTLRMPKAVRWELYPVPKGPRERQLYGGSYFEETEWWKKPEDHGRLGEFKFIIREVLTLHTVRENFPAFWPWSLALHWGLYLYIASVFGAIKVRLLHITFFDRLISTEFRIACLLGCLGALGLIIVRCVHPRLRSYTTRATMLNPIFLFLIFVTGAVSAFITADVTPSPAVAATSPGSAHFSAIASAHIVLLALFLAYFPFTHLTHMYMKYFTWHQVRWDDAATIHHPANDRDLKANLQRPVSWHAAHIAGSGANTWSDVVAPVPPTEARNA